MLAARYAPSKEQLIAEVRQRLEDNNDAVDVPLANMIREAKARAAGTEWTPLPPLEERITAEVARLEGMTAEEILAERVEEERKLRELIEEAKAKSAAEEQRIRTIYGKTADTTEDLR